MIIIIIKQTEINDNNKHRNINSTNNTNNTINAATNDNRE